MSKKSNKKKRPQTQPTPAPVKKEKIPMRSFAELFSLYYSNMPKLLLCDLIFAVPTLAIAAVLYFLLPGVASLGIAFLLIFVSIIIIYMLYAGVNSVTINIMDKNKSFSVPKVFFGGIAKYAPKFLLHSLAVAFCCFIAYFSFSFYSVLIQESLYYALFFVFYAVFVYIMLFVISHLPMLTIKLNGTLKEIYGTAFAMIAKNGINNLAVATIITAIAMLSYLFISMASGIWYLCLLMAAALLLIIPAFVALMSNFLLYDRVNAYLNPEQDKPAPAPQRQTRTARVELPQSEYVFYNGKMIKKEQLEKELAALEEVHDETV